MSDENLIIYHNPKCSKSRETLEILLEHQQKPNVVEYLSQPPDKLELARITELLNLSPRQLLRVNEPEYKALNLDDTSISDAQIIDHICENPRLLERPIVVLGDRAVIGRPPSRVLELL